MRSNFEAIIRIPTVLGRFYVKAVQINATRLAKRLSKRLINDRLEWVTLGKL